MTLWNAPLHVYAREISEEERTSLSVLASLVRPGARVLDLGCGSGALGRYLQERGQCTLDGVTLNDAEAELARPYYRRVEVANLDSCDLTSLFNGEHYDHIICADVLEHLRAPEQTLASCRSLLAAEGQVLISIPNAGYAGLIAELLQGEFTYRDEGLLDRTHLRFFTRQSLGQFLQSNGWGIQALDTIERELPESEFKVAFEALPPAVSRYLLAIPDALTYQFIVTARPGIDHAQLFPAAATPVHALFSASLYLGENGEYAEDRKLRATGVVGDMQQVVRFHLPPDVALTSLRLDLADRPGFLHLHSMALRAADGAPLWEWPTETGGLDILEACPHHDMLLHGPGLSGASVMVLLHGDDPWIELPLAAQAAAARGGMLEVHMGWPMSADFLALSESVRQERRQNEIAHQAVLKRLAAVQQQQSETHLAELSALDAQKNTLHAQNDSLRDEISRLREQAEALGSALSSRADALNEQRQALLDQKAGLISERNSLRHQTRVLLSDKTDLQQHLQWIENSTVFKATRPLVNFKMWLDAILHPAPPAVPPATLALPKLLPPLPSLDTPVDVIVPVYRGLEDTQRCIESALAHAQKTPWRLIVINDCSPDPEVTAWLREAAAKEPRIMLLENEENLGFVATVNRGMSVSESSDVILLNSDTEVANDWLDRLVRAAHTNGRVGTVTPFSNNATICSYPHFCQPNALPEGYTPARLDALFARISPGQVVDVPTGIGFCMYIRRDCLTEVGLFDVANFGKGYGEENDFCRRAHATGWRNLHALDTFVLHSGGVSFGDSKSAREQAAMETLRRLYPDYERVVHDFLNVDPARPTRLAVDLARVAESRLPAVLAVMHNREGGTVRHAEELAGYLQQEAVFFSLRPEPGSRVLLELLGKDEAFKLSFRLPEEWDDLLLALRHVGITHVHYHHLIGHHPDIMGLAERLGVTNDFTVHDHYTYCPQISLTDHTNAYCGEEGLDQCHGCLRRSPAPGGVSIETWRETHTQFLRQTRFILAPSMDTARRMADFVPGTDIRLAPHTDLPVGLPLPVRAPAPRQAGAPLRVLVIGALSSIKGADVLESVALAAAKAGASIEFHLIGYAYRNLQTQPRARLTVHGAYKEEDLPSLMDWLQPDVVWFPAQWPETYSYTLSACLEAGLPVAAIDLGAFPGRLEGRPWSWVRPWNSSTAEWLVFFQEIHRNHFMTGVAPEVVPALIATADARIQDWSYKTSYLRDLHPPATAPEPLPSAFLIDHRPGKTAGLEALRKGTRQQVLRFFLHLRSAPGLRSMARAVPLRWQTRVKSWLVH